MKSALIEIAVKPEQEAWIQTMRLRLRRGVAFPVTPVISTFRPWIRPTPGYEPAAPYSLGALW